MTIDTRDTATHSIFFDDKILDTAAHIVDLRDVSNGKRVDFEQAKGLYLIRVESFHAIQNHKYFIERLEEIERRIS